MKQQLLILSDLWGAQKATYLPQYTTLLQAKYDIQFIDCCEIGQVDTNDYTQENLHQQFVHRGINRAVDYLLKHYPKAVNILAFSIGGTIAWKANLAGLKVQNFLAISATRLRYETVKSPSQITLVYGALDAYRPDENWFNHLGITDYTILEQAGHDLYRHNGLISRLLLSIR